MALFPEKVSSTVEEIPEKPKIPENLQNEMQKVETAFTANVKDQTGAQVTQTPQNQDVKIDIPYTREQIKELSKGSIINAITWRAIYYWRMFKKALNFGKNIVWRENNAA